MSTINCPFQVLLQVVGRCVSRQKERVINYLVEDSGVLHAVRLASLDSVHLPRPNGPQGALLGLQSA